MRMAEARAYDCVAVSGQKLTNLCSVRSCPLPNRSALNPYVTLLLGGRACAAASHSSSLCGLAKPEPETRTARRQKIFSRFQSLRETLVMEKDHDNVTRCCRPSHARRNARKGQAAFALVSRTRRSDGSRRYSGADLSSGVVVRSGLSLGRPVSAVLSVIVGVLLIRHRGSGLLAITLLLLVYFMVEGVSKVIFSLTIRPFPNWGWILISGIVGILLSLYLWASLPVTALWLLGVLLGIQLICEGAALGDLAWQVVQVDALRQSGPYHRNP
jgi:hypothetical protein